MFRGRDLVVFSDDWGGHPFSCQHIFKRFLSANRVLWVNTVGYRALKLDLYDLRRGVGKIRGWLAFPSGSDGASCAVPEGLKIIKPFCLPFGSYPVVRLMNARSIGRVVRSVSRDWGFERPILVTTLPQAADYLGLMGESCSVYYCVDDFTLWPGTDGKLMQDLEQRLLKNIDLVIATSGNLLKTRSNGRRPTLLLSHGVDVDHFASVGHVEPAPAVADLRGGVVGLFGLIDERFDIELLGKVIETMPDVTFLVIGQWRVGAERLAGLPNLRTVGPVPYDKLPAYLGPVKVLLLPYSLNELTESINPLKLKECLATGLPVVATDLPETRKLERFVRIAHGAPGIAKALRDALRAERGRSGELEGFLRDNSWEHKAEEFAAAVEAIA